MKKGLLTILMCLCTVCVLTACSDKEENHETIENVEVEADENEEDISEEELAEENADENMTVTLYSYYTDSYYKVKVNKEDVYEYAKARSNEDESYDDLVVNDNSINENDLYSNVQSHSNDGIKYNVFSANQWYTEALNDKNRRMESGIADPSYNSEWTDYLNEYMYKNITYTISYQTNGSLSIFIKNPYTNIYDFLIMRTYIGKDNPDYLKIAEQYIDSVEFVEP